MIKRRIYFWEPELSPHKTPLVEAVQHSSSYDGAVYIAERPLNAKRVAQGWSTDLPADVEIIVSPDAARVDRIMRDSPVDSVHIFSGLRRVPSIVNGIRAAIRYNRHFGIFQEPRVFEGAAGWARLFESWLTESHIRKHAKFVLAVGRHGPSWFRMAGYSNDKVFPFAYFLAPPANVITSKRTLPLVVYLGRLERLKGVHLFVQSLEHIKSEIEVRVAGHGSLENLVIAYCERDSDHRTYMGVLPMSETRYLLGSADILVLPSITRDDGWGAVISEALMMGAAVVASGRVGASYCLANGRGEIVEKLQPKYIARAIDKIASDKARMSEQARSARSSWARVHLSAQRGSEYLDEIINHCIGLKGRPRSFLE